MSNFVIVVDNKVSNIVIADSYDDAVALFGESVIEYDPALILPKNGWEIVGGEIIDPNPFVLSVEQLEEQ